MDRNAKIKILVADDDHIMCELLKSILRQEGYNVVGGAHDGKAALELCASLQPDLVCLDVNMPKMGGIEALHAIRAAHPEIAAVMVSGEATADVVRNAAHEGACGFIVKPFNAAKIIDTIHRCTDEGAPPPHAPKPD